MSQDPDKRLTYHNKGIKGWIKRGIPWIKKYQKEFVDKPTAMEKERYLKSQKSRILIEQIIKGENAL